MKHKILFFLFVIASSITLNSCLKKGENDPAISLKSRKARVAGEWKVVSAKSVYTYNDATNPAWNYSGSYTMNGSTYTSVDTDASGTTTTTGTQTIDYTFDKDGTYKSTSTEDGVVSTEAGTWNFTAGVGELKNKSQITLYGQSYTYPGGSSTYTGNYVDGAYDLKELRNKKMVWYYKSTSTTTTSSSSQELEIEFEAK